MTNTPVDIHQELRRRRLGEEPPGGFPPPEDDVMPDAACCRTSRAPPTNASRADGSLLQLRRRDRVDNRTRS